MTLQVSLRSVRAWRGGLAALLGVGLLSAGCASYQGTARDAQPSVIAREGTWMMVQHFPRVIQQEDDDCGAAALAAVLQFWGYLESPGSVTRVLGGDDHRLKAGDMVTYARSLGLSSYVFHGTMQDIEHELGLGRPIIVGLGKQLDGKKVISHYQVVVGYEPKQKRVLMLDPGRGWQVDGLDGFKKEWALSKGVTIVAFLKDSDRRGSAQ